MAGLFDELKRRNVVRVGAAYVVLGWVVVQIAQLLFEAFGTPDWVIKTLIVLVGIGFPFALLFAWAFELTPDGLKKTREVDLSTSITHNTGRKLDFIIIATLAVALVYFIWERQTYNQPVESTAEPVAVAPEAPALDADEEVTATVRRSIAVLPFVNMSSDEEQEYFADGLTEEILNSLAKAPDLLVAARTSSFGFKGSTQPVPEIATALGVDHVLEGSVRRGGETLRITAQLIRASDGFHLWSETFDRTMEDIIAIQEEIAINIARALETALDPEALEEMMSSGTASVAAYEAWLTGVGLAFAAQESGDPYEHLASKEAWERAVEIDPEFSRALGRLSFFWSIQMSSNQITAGITELTVDEMRVLRDDYLERAIRFERDETTKLLILAGRALNENNLRQALRLYEDYRTKRPNDYERLDGLQFTLRALGMHNEVTALIKEIHANNELSRQHANSFAQDLRQPEEADFMRVVATEAIEKFDHNASLMYQVHRLLLWAGDVDGASRILPIIRNSDLPVENTYLAEMRQVCADQNSATAISLLDKIIAEQPDNLGLHWIALKILGDEDRATATFATVIETEDPDSYNGFLAYAHFDPKPFPEIMEAFAGQGLEDRAVIELPYRCLR